MPEGVPDEKVVFLTDIFPTGYMAAENANIEDGDTVAIWGCGPVGQFAIRSAFMLGAARVIAIDREPARMAMALTAMSGQAPGKVVLVDFERDNVVEKLLDLTGGRGPDKCIDCVGTEAFGHGPGVMLDYVKQQLRLETDRPNVLRQAMQACRKGGTISIPGVYGGILDSLNFGAAWNKGLKFAMGQTNVHQYLEPLMERIQNGEIDPSFVITHRGTLDDAPELYRTFRSKKSDCIKAIMRPYLA